MIMVQQFHSIHEIDPEFIGNIETLLQEEVANWDTLVQRHDRAPATELFTYFLFFGPTQNAPIGFAQLALKKIPSGNFRKWWQKLMFWDKEHEHWKQCTWQIGDGSPGLYVFDPRFARTGKEKIQDIIKDYEARQDIMAESLFCIKGLQDFQTTVPQCYSREYFVLEPFQKAYKTYQDYLASLKPELQSHLKKAWKELHKKTGIELGDYPTPQETPKTLPIEEDLLTIWTKWGAQVLTFEKDMRVLGCLLVLKGRNGNVFFEPFPFEPEGESLVSDELYTQYALLKFFEMPEARKCHLMKFGAKLVFEDRDDLQFFQEQGFNIKTISQTFHSRLKGLEKPL
jgi:hypothetical protein